MAGFVLKVLVSSTLLSIAIRLGGPYLPVSGSTATVLTVVWLPSALMLIILIWRWQQFQKGDGKQQKME